MWLTDRTDLPREAYGLTSHTIACDRMEFLYEVRETAGCLPFLEWARRRGFISTWRLIAGHHRPEHWWVSESALPARQVRLPGMALGGGSRTATRST